MEKKELGIEDILEECISEIGNLDRAIQNKKEDLDNDEAELLESIYKKLKQFYLIDEEKIVDCKDRVKRHSYSKISGWVIDKNKKYGSEINDNLDSLLLVLEYINNNICDDKDIAKSIKKLEDHIELEQKRLNYSDLRYSEFTDKLEEYKDLQEQMNSLSADIQKGLSEFKGQMDNQRESIDEELKTSKFDLLALTTLVFTAFTMVSLNVTIITGIINLNGSYTLSQIISTIIIVNVMLLSVIYLIYTIIGRIHGRIKNKEFWLTIIVIIIIFAGLLFLVQNLEVFITTKIIDK